MNFIIRRALACDAKAVHDIYQYYVDNTCITFTEINASVEDYEDQINNREYPFLVAENEAGEIIGFASGSRLRHHDAYRWNVESTIYLSKDAPKHSGIGKALYNNFMEECGRIGYKYVYGVITDTNEDSISFHKGLGFKEVGHFYNIGYKFGQWHGIVWYAKQIGDLNDMTMRTDY